MSKKTALYDSHIEQGGRIVEFAGFDMPVTFEGILAEHRRVRSKVGLFDVSHMGEIEVAGDGADEFVEYVVTQKVVKQDDGQIRYTVACNNGGKVLDDLLVYKFSKKRILLVVNAVNTEKIYEHVKELVPEGLEIKNLSDSTAQIAVQGPRSLDLLKSCGISSTVKKDIEELSYYRFISFEHDGSEVILSRTGYTGELGYEIYVKPEMAAGLWKELLEKGRDIGAAPIGLGARDTLRFEPSFCLYGHELDEKTSPLEAGLSWVVKFKKGDYVGREALESERDEGPARKLVGFELGGRGIARQGFEVKQGSRKIGVVTSGTFSPTLEKSLAMAIVSSDIDPENGDFSIDIRGKAVAAGLVELPFYKSRAGD